MYSRDSSPINEESRHSNSRAMMRHREMLVEASLLSRIKGKESILQVYYVSELGLTLRTLRRLRKAHINTLKDLVHCTESDVLYILRVGTTTLEEIKGKLNARLSMILSRGNWNALSN